MHQFDLKRRVEKPIAIWLMVIVVMLIAMIVVGGLTRLTDSGLSITEWKPVTGIVPPLSAEAWQSEFEKYQQIPEYKLQNKSMSIHEFKGIYWWEWGHRVLGRTIGFVVLLPMIFFWLRGMLCTGLKLRLSVLFVLGGFQGYLGWWMVHSGLGGLGDLLDVSPYRLVIHLGMALIILGLTLWTWMDIRLSEHRRYWQTQSNLTRLAWFLLVLVFAQLLLGGFVAGNDGGYIANTWPLIDGGLVPASFGDLQPFWRNWFENPLVAQFNHRIGAYLVLIVTLAYLWQVFKQKKIELRLFGLLVATVISLQVLLGIWTLVAVSPIPLAAAHQFLALLAFLSVLGAVHASSRYYRSS
ncbi:MAG: COX15/CtaA family protein [Robiginitomaculum sp.]|nr:COX15/CtaA family protein [Robiginitomaculum sp.]